MGIVLIVGTVISKYDYTRAPNISDLIWLVALYAIAAGMDGLIDRSTD